MTTHGHFTSYKLYSNTAKEKGHARDGGYARTEARAIPKTQWPWIAADFHATGQAAVPATLLTEKKSKEERHQLRNLQFHLPDIPFYPPMEPLAWDLPRRRRLFARPQQPTALGLGLRRRCHTSSRIATMASASSGLGPALDRDNGTTVFAAAPRRGRCPRGGTRGRGS